MCSIVYMSVLLSCPPPSLPPSQAAAGAAAAVDAGGRAGLPAGWPGGAGLPAGRPGGGVWQTHFVRHLSLTKTLILYATTEIGTPVTSLIRTVSSVDISHNMTSAKTMPC